MCKAGLVCDPVSMTCVKQGQAADARPPDAPPTPMADAPPGAAPDTMITDQPSAFTNQSPVSFSFTSTKAGSTFICRIDGGTFSACTSPQTYSGLADGPHTFEVKAVDMSGQQDPTAATASFTLDRAPPDTTITGGPSGDVAVSEAVFTFTCTEAPCTFQCQVDTTAFSDCKSGDTFDVTTLGPHTFRVKATDKAGNADPTPASQTWNVTALSLQTIILTGPPARTQATDATFTFECRFAGAIVSCTFVCTLDGAAASCTSPQTYSQLAEGTHTFQVVATSNEDHVTDPSPAERVWVIDRTPPVATITSPVAGSVTGPPVTFAYSANEDATFECDLGSGFAACDAAGFQQTLTGGSHTFAVRATDLAGNVGSPASVTWTVDAEGPIVTVTAPMAESGPNGTLDFTFVDLSPPVTFRCDFGQGFVDCAPGFQFTNLTGGSHTVTIEGTDKWGNKSTKPFTWNVDATGPTVTILSPQPGAIVPGTGMIVWTVPTADATRFTCTLDGAAVACSGTSVPYDLPTGDHTFHIVAFDKWDNPSVDPPSISTTRFTVDADRPVVVAGPPSGVCLPVVIPFNTVPPTDVVQFVCAVDNGPFNPCAKPSFTISEISNGPHVLRVIATDAVGNQSDPATVNFTVDLNGPLLTATPTRGTENTGTVTINFTSSEPLATLTGETHIANPNGDDTTVACAALGNNLTCSFLAANNNIVHARATDACGNASGSEVGKNGITIPGDTVTVAIAPFGPKAAPPNQYFASDGHVVLLGYDWVLPPGLPVDLLVSNAATLPPFTHRNLGTVFPNDARPVRVLMFDDEACAIILKPGGGAGGPPIPSCEGPAEVANLTDALGANVNVVVTEFSDPDLLDGLLPGYDILVVADQNIRSSAIDLSTISTAWTPILRPFVDNGGIVVVADGTKDIGDGVRGPTGTYLVIGGLLGVGDVFSVNQLQQLDSTSTQLRYGLSSSDGVFPSPEFWLTQGFDFFFRTPFAAGAVAYALDDGEQPTIVADIIDGQGGCSECGPTSFNRYALVVDKLFPVYSFGFDVGAPDGVGPNDEPVKVIRETGTLAYTLTPGNVGQTSVECRLVPQSFNDDLACGSDSTRSGSLRYDVTNANCPGCPEGVYSADLVAVTPSTQIGAGEGARAGSSSSFVYVDAGIFFSFLFLPQPNVRFVQNFIEFGTSFEPMAMQTFQCSISTLSGTPVSDSRLCNCPSPPAVCDPATTPPSGFTFAFYDFSQLGLDGAYRVTIDLKDGIGHTTGFDPQNQLVTFPLSLDIDRHAGVTVAANPGVFCGNTGSFDYTLDPENVAPSQGYSSATCQILTAAGVIESAACLPLGIPAAGGLQTYNTTTTFQFGTAYTFQVTVVDAWGNTATDSQPIGVGCIGKPAGGR